MEGRGAIRFSLEEADAVVNEHSAAPQGKTAMLLYLTKDTFLDSDGKVADAVRKALDLNISIALVAEQDVSRGGCPFSVFFDQTPKHLQVQPYSLYNELAVPYYPSPVHCTISRRHVLRKMGAEEMRLSESARGTDETSEAGAAVHPDPDPETGSLGGNQTPLLVPPSETEDALPLYLEDMPLSSEEVDCEAGLRQITTILDQRHDQQQKKGKKEEGFDPNRAEVFANARPCKKRNGMPQTSSRVFPEAGGTSEPPSSPFVRIQAFQGNQDAEAGPREPQTIRHAAAGRLAPRGTDETREAGAAVDLDPGHAAAGQQLTTPTMTSAANFLKAQKETRLDSDMQRTAASRTPAKPIQAVRNHPLNRQVTSPGA
jgi:hypothetical protein